MIEGVRGITGPRERLSRRSCGLVSVKPGRMPDMHAKAYSIRWNFKITVLSSPLIMLSDVVNPMGSAFACG